MASEFIDALKGLSTAVNQYAVGHNFRAANDRYQEIKNTLAPGVEQRQAQTDLANDLFSRLAQGGMDPTAAAAMRAQYLPSTPNSADQAVLMGTLNGDSAMLKAGHDLQQDQEALKLQSLNTQAKNNFELQTMLETGRDNRAALANDRALTVAEQKAKALKPLPPPLAAPIQTIEAANARMTSLIGRIEAKRSAVGPGHKLMDNSWLSWTQDAESVALRAEIGREFDQYRHDITGAAAGFGEIRELKLNSVDANQAPNILLANLKALVAGGNRVKIARLESLQKMGHPIGGYADDVANSKLNPNFTADPNQQTGAGGRSDRIKSFIVKGT